MQHLFSLLSMTSFFNKSFLKRSSLVLDALLPVLVAGTDDSPLAAGAVDGDAGVLGEVVAVDDESAMTIMILPKYDN
jgi:hypothetical protein